jgi:hypothetical protein
MIFFKMASKYWYFNVTINFLKRGKWQFITAREKGNYSECVKWGKINILCWNMGLIEKLMTIFQNILCFVKSFSIILMFLCFFHMIRDLIDKGMDLIDKFFFKTSHHLSSYSYLTDGRQCLFQSYLHQLSYG